MTQSVHAAVLGKVPWQNEFLRRPGLTTELEAFDEWLFRNAQLPFADKANGASYGFLLQLDANSPLSGIAGVVGPSQDLAGRSYPLAIAGQVAIDHDVAAHPELVPIVLELYWHTAVEILLEARKGPPDAGDWQLERLSQTRLESAATAFDLYADWTGRTGAAELCSLLGRPASWLAYAVRTISDAVIRERGRSAPVRVPLGRAAGGALCFWLDVMRRAAGWHSHMPTFFWSHDEQAGDALVFVGAPGETALANLWAAGASPDCICDLTADLTADDRARSTASDSASVHSELDGFTGATLWRVLERIEAARQSSGES